LHCCWQAHWAAIEEAMPNSEETATYPGVASREQRRAGVGMNFRVDDIAAHSAVRSDAGYGEE
jgi:hypothetical protein